MYGYGYGYGYRVFTSRPGISAQHRSGSSPLLGAFSQAHGPLRGGRVRQENRIGNLTGASICPPPFRWSHS